MSKALQLSIVIPAYNEAPRIGATLEKLLQFLETQHYDFEILVVNDGSKDQTVEIVQNFAAALPTVRLIDNGENLGKGASVKNGIFHALGEVVLFTDADLSSPAGELPKILDPIFQGDAEVTFGSRALDRSLIGVHQSAFREFSGKVFNFFVRILTGLPFKDTQCGFKAFRRLSVLPVFERQRIGGYGFDPEVLFIAKKKGLRLREIPVRWNHVEGTKVRMSKDSIVMFWDLVRIRLNNWKRLYN
jgi:dolichyl-phosphate beta-glucosyltransferase